MVPPIYIFRGPAFDSQLKCIIISSIYCIIFFSSFSVSLFVLPLVTQWHQSIMGVTFFHFDLNLNNIALYINIMVKGFGFCFNLTILTLSVITFLNVLLLSRFTGDIPTIFLPVSLFLLLSDCNFFVSLSFCMFFWLTFSLFASCKRKLSPGRLSCCSLNTAMSLPLNSETVSIILCVLRP